ncbi:haloalkane dehalogenase [Pseudohongiella spirulinae]|uniref:Haloalkane dehalogenase n=1 Tax=Pseudohongiella spirulinae TaxID=1249552 RepID=A0A0S2KGV1_9GAMM|nr:haloalkane dehalogenase [Pseudohongiella spirulinae]ALO47547.1 haloalkane dehalogenase [Pseudohongiella spirulinae]
MNTTKSHKNDVLRTPDVCFDKLPDFPFAPNYGELPGFEGIRVHYLDEGSVDSDDVVLCLHGQPTWSYLYRKMIPVFVQRGHRVLVPDLIGFGRSDKPVDESFYTFSRHRDMLLSFIQHIVLAQRPHASITLVVQDWGGLLGLTLPMAFPDSINRLLIMNTALGTGDVPLGQGFLDWRAYSNSRPDLDIAALMKRGEPTLSDSEAAAYAAPFPDQRYKAGVRRFPNLVPDHPDADGAALSRQAREFFANKWQGESFMAIGMRDPVLGAPVMQHLRKLIRGCPPPMEIAEAGHFVQEHGEQIARQAFKTSDI